jgi:hypothetical protein
MSRSEDDILRELGLLPQKKTRRKSTKKKTTKKTTKKAKRQTTRKPTPRARTTKKKASRTSKKKTKTSRKKTSTKKKVAVRKKTSKAKRTRTPAPRPTAATHSRVSIPDKTFYAWRDKHGDWPDGFANYKSWITYKGAKYWPFIVQQHSIVAFKGAKMPHTSKGEVEFVAAGGPIKVSKNPLERRCPYCKAAPGKPCRKKIKGKKKGPVTSPHKARFTLTAAEKALREGGIRLIHHGTMGRSCGWTYVPADAPSEVRPMLIHGGRTTVMRIHYVCPKCRRWEPADSA